MIMNRILHRKAKYEQIKVEIAEQALQRVVSEYPFLEGEIRVIDIWSPMTYTRYCNSYKGAYMSFVTTKRAKSITVPGVVKGLDNVFLASQWLMGFYKLRERRYRKRRRMRASFI